MGRRMSLQQTMLPLFPWSHENAVVDNTFWQHLEFAACLRPILLCIELHSPHRLVVLSPHENRR